MKTIEDYLHDPEIEKMPEYLREIHAARRLIQEETAGMTVAEEAEYHRKQTEKLFAGLGLPPPQYADLSGQGKSKPHQTMVPDK